MVRVQVEVIRKCLTRYWRRAVAAIKEVIDRVDGKAIERIAAVDGGAVRIVFEGLREK